MEAPLPYIRAGIHGCRREANYSLPPRAMFYQVYLSNFTVEACSQRDALEKAKNALRSKPSAYIWRVQPARVYKERRGLFRKVLKFLFSS